MYEVALKYWNRFNYINEKEKMEILKNKALNYLDNKLN